MNHSFDVRDAQQYGVEEAIMIQSFRFWIEKNKANKKHFHDGKWWTYNSVEAMEILFPYWSQAQRRRIVQSLIDQGVLVTGNYNSDKFDRTLWYAFSTDAFDDSDKSSFVDSDKSSTTDTIPDTTNSSPMVEEKIEPEKFPPESIPYRLAKLIYTEHLSHDPKFLRGGTDERLLSSTFCRWADDIDKLIRLDGRDEHEIAKAIRWAQADDFWCSNILSGATLRKQFPKLSAKMNGKSVAKTERSTIGDAILNSRMVKI